MSDARTLVLKQLECRYAKLKADIEETYCMLHAGKRFSNNRVLTPEQKDNLIQEVEQLQYELDSKRSRLICIGAACDDLRTIILESHSTEGIAH